MSWIKKKKIPPFAKLVNVAPLTEWETSAGVANLTEYYDAVLKIADNTIAWYQSYRKRKGRWAKGIRLASVLLLIASTMIPYVASLNESDTKILYFGYLLAGLGGGLILFDKYSSFTTSWTRFILTGLHLESTRNIFVSHYLSQRPMLSPLTKENFSILIKEIGIFQQTFDKIIITETETWANEFREILGKLGPHLEQQQMEMKRSLEESRQRADEKVASEVDPGSSEISDTVFQEAIAKNGERWKKEYNVVAIAYGNKVTDGNTVPVKSLVFLPPVKREKSELESVRIPPFIEFTNSEGKLYMLPTDVRETSGPFRAAAKPELLCDKFPEKRPGCSISRVTDQDKENTGTIGLKVYKGSRAYVLSCYHVLCAPELKKGKLEFNPARSEGSAGIVSPAKEDSDKGIKIGSVTNGILDHRMDAAIMIIPDGVKIDDKLCALNVKPVGMKTVLKADVDKRLSVVSVGRTSGVIPGSVELHDTSCDIEYYIKGIWQIKTIEGVILTDQRSCPGDSGSAVLDTHNNVIGILAACSGNMSCVIPIGRILSKFSITIKPST